MDAGLRGSLQDRFDEAATIYAESRPSYPRRPPTGCSEAVRGLKGQLGRASSATGPPVTRVAP